MTRNQKIRAALIGSGNIGTDLMYKLLGSNLVEPIWMVGIEPQSDGLARAKKAGLETSASGIEALLQHADEFDIVFDATSAKAHVRHASLLADAGKTAIDLTPSAVGVPIVPAVNFAASIGNSNVNLLSCGAQATVPIVRAIGSSAAVSYAEIVSTIASKSAGPGTRQNIDEFTQTTARGLEDVAGAIRGKAIIVLNPAEPPIMMRNTVFAMLDTDHVNQDAIVSAISETVREIQCYVPGYTIRGEPLFDGPRVTVLVEVAGAGDYLPRYAGNLDIMTSAALQFAERLAKSRLDIEGPSA